MIFNLELLLWTIILNRTFFFCIDWKNMLNRIHPPRPDWYEEFYASTMNSTMKSYEAEVSSYL